MNFFSFVLGGLGDFDGVIRASWHMTFVALLFVCVCYRGGFGGKLGVGACRRGEVSSIFLSLLLRIPFLLRLLSLLEEAKDANIIITTTAGGTTGKGRRGTAFDDKRLIGDFGVERWFWFWWVG